MKLREWIANQPIGARGSRIQAVASQCAINPSAVRHWISGKRQTPAHRCLAVEVATGGVVTRYDLRPDVFGDSVHNKDS